VTVVATGLGPSQAAQKAKSQPQLVVSARTGTDNQPVGAVDYGTLEATPAVFRRNRSTVEALQKTGVDKYDIPAFLRKQAD
ncbi:MAG: cell division protein FtsZ, partial [Burkholderiales bacterium]